MEVQKNYEQSLKENQDMKKIMAEHKRLKQSLQDEETVRESIMKEKNSMAQ